jgi:hypothetical protein
MTAAGFPHSGITGSQPACGSPMLFAAYHALHRLSVPRHPPCALLTLDRKNSQHIVERIPATHLKPTTHTLGPNPGATLPPLANENEKPPTGGRCSPRPFLTSHCPQPKLSNLRQPDRADEKEKILQDVRLLSRFPPPPPNRSGEEDLLALAPERR